MFTNQGKSHLLQNSLSPKELICGGSFTLNFHLKKACQNLCNLRNTGNENKDRFVIWNSNNVLGLKIMQTFRSQINGCLLSHQHVCLQTSSSWLPQTARPECSFTKNDVLHVTLNILVRASVGRISSNICSSSIFSKSLIAHDFSVLKVP